MKTEKILTIARMNDLCHEFNSTICVLSGRVELGRKNLSDPEKTKETFNKLEAVLKRFSAFGKNLSQARKDQSDIQKTEEWRMFAKSLFIKEKENLSQEHLEVCEDYLGFLAENPSVWDCAVFEHQYIEDKKLFRILRFLRESQK